MTTMRRCISCNTEYPASAFEGTRKGTTKVCAKCRAVASRKQREKLQAQRIATSAHRKCTMCGGDPTDWDMTAVQDWRHFMTFLNHFRGEFLCSDCLMGAETTKDESIRLGTYDMDTQRDKGTIKQTSGAGPYRSEQYRFTREEHRRWSRNLRKLQEGLRNETRLAAQN